MARELTGAGVDRPAEGREAADAYCPVTIVCGPRRIDLALPTSVCCADLMPGLLRLIRHDDTTGPPDSWELSPVVGTALAGSDTLTSAGILAGDVLVLGRWSAGHRPTPPVVTTRDRIEDVVNGHARFWGPRAALGLTHWVAVLVAVALLVPAAGLPNGIATAGAAAFVAILVTMTALLADRRAERACAAVGLLVGCGWAALATASAFRWWASAAAIDGQFVGPLTMTVATGSALLLAGSAAAVHYPVAVVHSTALLVVGVASIAFAAALFADVSIVDTACIAAVIAVLTLGTLPRVALAVGGLAGGDSSREPAELDGRIARADRVLLGSLVGVSVIATVGAIPAALSGDGGPRLLAIGIGTLLLLRSRAFSQTPHVLPLRIGGLVILAALWLGVYREDGLPHSLLIVGAMLGSAALTALIAVIDRAATPVGRARSGRVLDFAEQVLVVGLIVMTAGVVVLFDWMLSVIG